MSIFPVCKSQEQFTSAFKSRFGNLPSFANFRDWQSVSLEIRESDLHKQAQQLREQELQKEIAAAEAARHAWEVAWKEAGVTPHRDWPLPNLEGEVIPYSYTEEKILPIKTTFGKWVSEIKDTVNSETLPCGREVTYYDLLFPYKNIETRFYAETHDGETEVYGAVVRQDHRQSEIVVTTNIELVAQY